MIVVFSTSSPQASVALFEPDGRLLASRERLAPMAAGEACGELLEACLVEAGLRLEQASLFVADVGPGSFTGIKVGVTLAKVQAYFLGVQCAGVSSFDLINAGAPVAVPTRPGEWILRKPGCDPEVVSGFPEAVGYGKGVADPVFPSAANARVIGLAAVEPARLEPLYVTEPSISLPKTPFPEAHRG